MGINEGATVARWRCGGGVTVVRWWCGGDGRL
jgi:hypothetical protein